MRNEYGVHVCALNETCAIAVIAPTPGPPGSPCVRQDVRRMRRVTHLYLFVHAVLACVMHSSRSSSDKSLCNISTSGATSTSAFDIPDAATTTTTPRRRRRRWNDEEEEAETGAGDSSGSKRA